MPTIGSLSSNRNLSIHPTRNAQGRSSTGKASDRVASLQLVVVKEHLLPKIRSAASDLRSVKGLILSVSTLLDAEHSDALADWQEIKDNTQIAINEARVIAVKWSTLLKEIISIVLPAIEVAGLEELLSPSAETLKGCFSEVEQLEKKLQDIVERIRAFQVRWGEECLKHEAQVQSRISQAEALLVRLSKPAESLRTDMVDLLNSAPFVGIMEVLVALLPPATAIRVNELLNDKESSNGREAGDNEFGHARGTDNFSELRYLLSAGYFLREDMLKIADSMHSKSPSNNAKSEPSPRILRRIFALYATLQDSLDTLVEHIEEGRKRGTLEAGISHAKAFASKYIQVLWRWYGFSSTKAPT